MRGELAALASWRPDVSCQRQYVSSVIPHFTFSRLPLNQSDPPLVAFELVRRRGAGVLAGDSRLTPASLSR